MRLPPSIKIGVQQLGREDPSSIVAGGRAVAGALSSIGDAVGDYQAKKTDAENREARLRMSQSMAEFESKFGGKDFLSSDDVPDDIEIRRFDKVTSADGSVQEVLREQIPAHEVYPQLYKKFAEANIESSAAVIENERFRSQWVMDMQTRANEGYANRATVANSRQEAFLKNQLMDQIQLAVDSQDYTSARILADDIVSDEERAKVVRNIDATREMTYINSLIMGGAETDEDLTAIEDEIQRLRDPAYTYSIPYEQRIAKADALERSSAEHEASMVERKRREDEQIVSDMWISIESGDPKADEYLVQKLFDENLINGGTMTAMKRTIMANHANALKKTAVNINLDYIANSPYGIDPKDKDARAAVNDRYNLYVQESDDKFGSAIRAMREFKVVPEDVLSSFRASNRADAAGLAESSRLWIQAENYAPQSLSDFKDDDVNVVRQVAANIRLGMSAGDAIEQVRRYDTMTPEQKSALKENSKMVRDNNAATLADMVNDQESYKLPWGWVPFKRGVPDIPIFMMSEFDSSVQKYMPQVGYNQSVAQRMAFTDISKQWNRTDVNGDWQLMKFAPQAPTDQIRSLIRKQYGFEKGVVIASDVLTQMQIQGGMAMSYQAYKVIDKDTGEIEMLPRFNWDGVAAADANRNRILEEGKKARANRPAQLEQQVRFAERGMK